MEEESIIVSEGERPIWQMIIAALLYTFSIFFLCYFFYTFRYNLDNGLTKRPAALFELSVYCFVFAFGFSSKNTKFFNLKDKKYKNQYSVGLIKVGRWKTLPNLEYVSIFKNGRGIFEVNIWYNRNKRFSIYNYSYKEEALETGFDIANQLNIKLLDATTPNKNKFLDLDLLKGKYE